MLQDRWMLVGAKLALGVETAAWRMLLEGEKCRWAVFLGPTCKLSSWNSGTDSLVRR